MNQFDDIIKKHTQWLENEYVAGALTIFLILYANLAAPNLPKYVAKMFDHMLFKILIFALIVYMFNKKPTVAILSAIALMAVLMIMDKVKISFDASEKMTLLSSENGDELMASLKELLNRAVTFVKSQEGIAMVDETVNAVEAQQLHPAEAEVILNKVIRAEEQGTTPLVALSEKGAQHMESVAKDVTEGKIQAQEGRRIAAQIVIFENISNLRQNYPTQMPVVEQEKQMLADKVLEQKQLIEEQNAYQLTPSQLKQLCDEVSRDYESQKHNDSTGGITGLAEYDNNNYAKY